MPRLIYIPNYFEPHNREISECRVGIPVARILPGYLDFKTCQCIHRGKVETIDLMRFKFEKEDDELIVRQTPGISVGALIVGVTGVTIAEATLMQAAAIVAIDLVIAATVSFGIGQLVNALLPAPKTGSSEYQGEVTPNYGWDEVQNTAQNGLPIQLVYGKHKVAGQILASFVDSVDDGKSTLAMLIGLCAGQISAINGYTTDQTALAASACGDGLQLDTNSGDIFSGMTVSYRLGAWSQEIIAGFDDVITQYDTSQELAAATTAGTGYVYTTTSDVQAVELIFAFPNGLYEVTDGGGVIRKTCTISTRYREDDSAASWTTAVNTSFNKETRSRWNCKYRIDFPKKGKYQIDMVRVSAADGLQSVSNIYVTGIKEINYDDVAYRGIALCGIKAVATEQLNGRMPNVTNVVHGKICTVYHPDDDFGSDTAQTFSADGTALWGWTAANTAYVESADANTYATHTLSVLHDTTSTNWNTTTVTGPYVYKTIYGTAWDVRVRGQIVGGTTSGCIAAILMQSVSDATDWMWIGSYHDGANLNWYFRHCQNGTNLLSDYGTSTDTYFRLTRASSTFTAYTSADGVTWTQRAQRTSTDYYATSVKLGLMSATPSNTDGTHRSNFTDFNFADTTGYSEECSSNPAWVIYDLLTDTHYGVGNYIDTDAIDTESFIDFADYCNELVSDGNGGTQRRHRFDGVIDVNRAAWDTVNRIAENSRAAVVKSGNVIRVLWQDARDAVQLFAVSNIKAGSFAQVYQSPEVGANYWEVQYLNSDQDWDQDYATYLDTSIPSGEPYRRQTISAYGITREAEAIRKALWHCKCNRYITHMVSFETGVDAIACQPGDRIEVQHDVPQWGQGGRVVSAATTSITVEKAITLEAGTTYEVMVRHADDTIETRTIQDSAGTYYTLTVLPAWTTTPAADEVWAIGEEDIVTKPFIVTSIKRTSELECSIEALEYNADVYDDEIETIQHVTYSTLADPRTIPDEVEELVLTERTQIQNDGSIRNVIDVSYALPTGSTRANIYWRENGTTPWEQVGRQYGTQYTIDAGVVHGITYDVCVAAVSPYGLARNADACSYATITIVGKTTAPSNVSNVRVSRIGSVVYIRWTGITDSDLEGYEVRYGASTWATCTVLGQTASTEFSTPDVSGGHSTYFQVKAFNTSGIYSATAAWALVTLPARYGENILVERNEVTETWDGDKTDTEVVSTFLQLDQTQTAPATSGSYQTPVIDCGASVRSLASVWLKVTQSYAGLTWADATFTWGSTTGQAMTWGGPAGESHVTATLSFRYGDTLDTAGDVDGDYELFQVGDYTGRYFQFLLELEVDSAEYNAVVEEMVTTIDVPDLMCSDTNVTCSGTADTTITFTTQVPSFAGFNVAPDFIAIPYNPSNPGDFVLVSAVTSTTATVGYYNAAGSRVAGACNFIAKGY